MVVSVTEQARAQGKVVRGHAESTVDFAQRTFRRHIRGKTDISMIPGSLTVDGLELRYAVSNNDTAHPEQQWALNIHGFFAGGSMYHRESERLAEAFGWRVINPSLPGFGGSDPLAWNEISMSSLTRRVEALIDHFGINEVILIGHSMGAGVAIEYAAMHPQRVLGIIYRDGVSTPAWQERRGIFPFLVSKVVPDVAPVADLAASVAFDLPDLFVGRMLSTVRSVLPDLRLNLKTLARSAPVASMLMTTDQTAHVHAVQKQAIPILAEWGCFDHVTTASTAREFSKAAEVEVQWVPGGHSWMLARPSGQADILRYVDSGRAFMEEISARDAFLKETRPHLRSVI